MSKHPIIKIIGVGSGNNTLQYVQNTGIKNVEFLEYETVPENNEQIKNTLSEATNMIFLIANSDESTNIELAIITAKIAKELDILTIVLLIKPFDIESENTKELYQACDTLLIIPNEKNKNFSQANNIIATIIKNIIELIIIPQEINLDFDDVKTVMKNAGAAFVGFGKADGENRSLNATKKALNSSLLTTKNISGATKILLSVTAGKAEIKMEELCQITDYINEQTGQNALTIFGAGNDESLNDAISVMIIATGF